MTLILFKQNTFQKYNLFSLQFTFYFIVIYRPSISTDVQLLTAARVPNANHTISVQQTDMVDYVQGQSVLEKCKVHVQLQTADCGVGVFRLQHDTTNSTSYLSLLILCKKTASNLIVLPVASVFIPGVFIHPYRSII